MRRYFAGREGCAGMGLAEMMVALLLGMALALAAAGMLVASNAAYVNHGAHVRLDDGGRLALALIGQALRQAAFVNWEPGQAPGVPAERSASIAGLDAHTLPRASQAIDGARPGAVNGSDVLALRFSGSGFGSGAFAADGSALNCAGFAVGGGASEAEQGWSIFYVALAADGEAELRCKYRADSGWTSDALVRGVDAFQVLYGLDTDTPPDGIPNRFLNATEINALDEALVLAAGSAGERQLERNRKTHWKRIASVRVALLLHGEFASRPAGPPLRYALFGPQQADEPDALVDEAAMPKSLRERARRLFAISVVLRNTGKG